jgi:hypothetical protein
MIYYNVKLQKQYDEYIKYNYIVDSYNDIKNRIKNDLLFNDQVYKDICSVINHYTNFNQTNTRYLVINYMSFSCMFEFNQYEVDACIVISMKN